MRGTLSALFTYFDSEETPGTIMPLWTITMTTLPELQGEPKTERDDNTPLWAMPVPSSLHFRLLFPTPNTPVGKSLQRDIADFAQRLFRETDSSYGFISLDISDIYNDLAATKFERDNGINTVNSTRFLARKVRGAFWENYLTTGHIYQLGGIRSIKANAPCMAKELNSDKAVALRLTEDVNDVTLSQIEALEHYFRPLALTKVELEERSRPG